MFEVVDSERTDQSPNTLFHYTSLESLALILRNKTIRLNPLNKMDDLQEAKAKNGEGFTRYVFVSCWTEDATESIPMWNMYAGLDRGVRIEMRVDPFRRYTYTDEQMSAITGLPIGSLGIKGSIETFLPAEDMKIAFSSAFISGAGVLRKVEYVSDIDLLEPTVLTLGEKSFTVDTSALGQYKNKHWEFQHEWRYMLSFNPFDIFGDTGTNQQRLNMAVAKMMNQSEPSVFDYYDLHLSDDALKEMKVTLSPKISPGNRILAEALFRQYGLEGCVVESELCGLI